ncbi:MULTISPECIES: hypothetical protein [unclassified Streptomyces]
MQARIQNPAEILPEALPPVLALVLSIGLTNLFNRINVTIRQPPGKTW